MTTTKSTGGTSAMAADSTNDQRNMQQRVKHFIGEVAALKTKINMTATTIWRCCAITRPRKRGTHQCAV